MSRDVVDADHEHFNATLQVLVENYPIEYVRSILQLTLDGLKWRSEDLETQGLLSEENEIL